jgi:hypothetical protein
MRRSIQVLSAIFLVSLIVLISNTCRKEEFVIVYSKVSTKRVYNTTSTSVSVEGSIDSLTSAAHDEFGFCLDTLSDPTVYKQKLLATGTVQLGTFGGSITGLKPSSTYHVRAFIKDNNKYLYGQDLSFTTTAAILPTVTTSSVTEEKATTATGGGNVTSEGDRPVLAKGVCYDTISTPTILKNKTMDGWGTGAFTSSIMNLVPNKTYYARAYAVSEFGVGYGSQKTFTTKKALYTFHEDFTDNTNKWDIGDFDGGTAKIENGKYSISYQKSGYLWTGYNKFPDFKSISSKDFEISTKIWINSYNPLNQLFPEAIGGLIWSADDTHFSYFAVKQSTVLDKVYKSKSYVYSYQIGKYDGDYTIWKDYTIFTGTDSTKLTIKKANSKFYFFVNDFQVYSRSYSSTTYDGIGFLIQNSTVSANYLYIDQKDYKKSADAEIIEMKSLPGGNSIIRSFVKK